MNPEKRSVARRNEIPRHFEGIWHEERKLIKMYFYYMDFFFLDIA